MDYRDDWFNNNKSDHGWYTCAKCGRKLRKGDADIDHILPQSYGGGDGLDNLAVPVQALQSFQTRQLARHRLRLYAQQRRTREKKIFRLTR